MRTRDGREYLLVERVSAWSYQGEVMNYDYLAKPLDPEDLFRQRKRREEECRRRSQEDRKAFFALHGQIVQGMEVNLPEQEAAIQGGRVIKKTTPCGEVEYLRVSGWEEVAAHEGRHLLKRRLRGVEVWAAVTRLGITDYHHPSQWIIRFFVADRDAAAKVGGEPEERDEMSRRFMELLG